MKCPIAYRECIGFSAIAPREQCVCVIAGLVRIVGRYDIALGRQPPARGLVLLKESKLPGDSWRLVRGANPLDPLPTTDSSNLPDISGSHALRDAEDGFRYIHEDSGRELDSKAGQRFCATHLKIPRNQRLLKLQRAYLDVREQGLKARESELSARATGRPFSEPLVVAVFTAAVGLIANVRISRIRIDGRPRATNNSGPGIVHCTAQRAYEMGGHTEPPEIVTPRRISLEGPQSTFAKQLRSYPRARG